MLYTTYYVLMFQIHKVLVAESSVKA